jgi:dTDP-4-dehydrorhamnose 3,5-epimerase
VTVIFYNTHIPNDLTIEDLISTHKNLVYTQSYEKKPSIDGIQVLPIPHFVVDDGDFSELLRLTDQGTLEVLPEFHLRQINRSRLFGGSVKGWHVHYRQDELWYVPPASQLMVGLWDVRETSNSKGTTMRVVLGAGKSSLLYIPRGVAHGCANFSHDPTELFYFVNGQFDSKNPDEQRLPQNAHGEDFWKPAKD